MPNIWEDKKLLQNFQEILKAIGEDPQREGLLDTPKRFLKALWETTHYEDFNFTDFANEHPGNEMVIEKGITFHSLCEHHILPFFGTVYIGYIPSQKIVGLSKLVRAVEFYSRKLQNQERLTNQIAEMLMERLNPLGVIVITKARHMCMESRGVRKPGVETIVTAAKGVLLANPSAKAEFLSNIKL